MTIGTNNLEEEMAAMKAMLEQLVKDNEKRRHASSYTRKRSPC